MPQREKRVIQTILVDSREPNGTLDRCKEYFKNTPCLSLALKAGDYRITTEGNETILIERKTVSDLLESIKDNRLFNQASAMAESEKWSFLVVVGQMSEHTDGSLIYSNGGEWLHTQWSYNAVQGALMTVQELGVVVCHTSSFFSCVERICSRSRDEVKVMPRREPVVFGGGEVVLSSLPGIGAKKALDLISHFRTVSWALVFLTSNDWEENIKGIGPVTKMKIKETLGLKEGQNLSIDNGD
jgi:ERCC4-type nuclease